jgi:metal-dependent hydrolase (beta-lactamase superfamily II)
MAAQCFCGAKTIGTKPIQPMKTTLIDIAARCLLIRGNRLILIDTGMWAKQSENFFRVLFALGNTFMDKSLAKYGFHRDDITDVFMTHLHFDHCGGSVQWNRQNRIRTCFLKMLNSGLMKITGNGQQSQTQRESIVLSENILPMQESGQLNFIQRSEGDFLATSNWFWHFFADGHTESK